MPIKVRQATKAGVSKRSKKSGSVRHTKNAKPSFYALFRAFFPFFAATGNTHVRVRPEKTVSSEKTVKRSRPRSEDFAALHPVRKSAHGNKHITPEDLANLKELFRAKVSERKKVATLPSSLLLGKKGNAGKTAAPSNIAVPVDGDFDQSLEELLAEADTSIKSTILTYHEGGDEQRAVQGGDIPAVASLPAKQAPQSALKKFFFMGLPVTFGSKAKQGKITSATAPKQRQEMPLDISVEEMRPLKGPATKAAAEPEDVSRKKKSKQESKEETTVKITKKETAADKEKAAKEEKERDEALKEMEAGARRRRTALRAQQPSGLRQLLSALAHFGLGKEKTLFTQNLATMLNAGLPLIDAIKILQVETKSRGMKKIIQHILDSVENGSALWRAMEEQNLFSPHAISLIHIGEEAGNLAENMEYLSVQQEKDHALRQKVKMAMIYPAIVMTLMFIIVMGLGIFVLPNLIQVLFSLNVPLPFITRVVIAFTNAFSTYGKTAVPAMLGGIVLLMILAKFTPLKIVTQWVIFHIPGVGKLAKQATIARFGVILGGLLKAGVPLVEALRSLADVTPIASYKKFYVKLLDRVSLGDSFSKSFATIRGSKRLLPVSVQQLVTTGEQSGSLADILLKVSDIYEKKANETAQKLPIILEPMILLFIGALVGTIALAIIVPIYSIVGTVGRG